MRIKRGTVSHRKHKKLLSEVKGYRMTKRRLVKVAREASLHAGSYAYAGRKKKKSDFRRLWITRISNYLSLQGLSYSQFINKLKQARIELNRKMLAHLLLHDEQAFKMLLDKINKS